MKQFILIFLILLIGLSAACKRKKDPDLLPLFLGLWWVNEQSQRAPDTSTATPAASCTASGSSFGGPSTGQVQITEVGYRFSLSSNWVEVHNGSSAPINLGDYSLRVSNTWSAANSAYGGIRSYPLPNAQIPAGAYIILRGNAYDNYSSSFTFSLIDAEGYMPFWLASGFVELIKDGQTADFVRFGSDSTAPTTPQAWSGGGTVALTDTYNGSLRRNALGTDTDTASDWAWGTGISPNLPNEDACTQDADADGLPDCAEQPGRSYMGLPYYDWGARVGQRDMFVEIDYMKQDSSACPTCPDGGLLPAEASLERLRQKFLEHGVHVHFDAGDLFDRNGITGDNPARFDLCNAGSVPFTYAVAFSSSGGATSVFEMKDQHMDPARRNVFFYVFYSYSDSTSNPRPDYAGIATVSGGTLLMALARLGLNSGSNFHANYNSSVLFHELGHNLGLGHGGDTGDNYKINYFSAMNYLYAYGLATIGQDEHSLYYHDSPYAPSACANLYANNHDSHMRDSPATFPIDYSNGSGAAIDENAINESQGIGRAGALAIDVNCNGVIDSAPVARNLTSVTTLDIITDHDDWSALTIWSASSLYPWYSSPPASAARMTSFSRNPYATSLPNLRRNFSPGVPDRIAGLARGRNGSLLAVPAIPGAHVWMEPAVSERERPRER